MIRFSLTYALAAGCSLIFVAASAFADVGSPKSANVTKGRASIEYKGARTGDDIKARNNAQGHEIELYYGLTDAIKLGFERKMVNEPSDGLKHASYIPNITAETTRQGEWWLSTAVFGEYAFRASAADGVKLMLIAERKQGPLTIRGNLGLSRDIGRSRDTGIGYESALQGLYRVSRHTHPGIEWHSDYGTLNHASAVEDQKHYIGPVLTGTLLTLDEGSVHYAAGYYWGLTDASANNAQRLMLKYEMQF